MERRVKNGPTNLHTAQIIPLTTIQIADLGNTTFAEIQTAIILERGATPRIPIHDMRPAMLAPLALLVVSFAFAYAKAFTLPLF